MTTRLGDPAPTLQLEPTADSVGEIERHIRCRVGNRLTGLAVSVVPEGIILHGVADCYYVRQLAVAVARTVPGLRLHADRIRVARADDSNGC